MVRREIAVGRNVHAVAGDGVEAEGRARCFAVVQIPAREGTETERHLVGAAARFAERS